MDSYFMRIKIKDGEVEEVLNELEQAQKTIYECYEKLRTMGFLTVEKAASGN